MTDISGLFAHRHLPLWLPPRPAGPHRARHHRLAMLRRPDQRHLRHRSPDLLARHPGHGPLRPLAAALPAPRSPHRSRRHPRRRLLHLRLHCSGSSTSPISSPSTCFLPPSPSSTLSLAVHLHPAWTLPSFCFPSFHFPPELRKSRPRIPSPSSRYLLADTCSSALYPSHLRGDFPLEPAQGDWVVPRNHGASSSCVARGPSRSSSHRACGPSLLRLNRRPGRSNLFAAGSRRRRLQRHPSTRLSWSQLAHPPWSFHPSCTSFLVPAVRPPSDPRALPLSALLVVALLCLVRFYQERVQPAASPHRTLVVAAHGDLSIAVTHNTFALYRARIALAANSCRRSSRHLGR